MNLAFRKPTFPATMEKYYNDVLLPDGSVLLIYLGTVSLFGVRFARLRCGWAGTLPRGAR